MAWDDLLAFMIVITLTVVFVGMIALMA